MKSYKFEHIDAEASNVVPFCGELFTIYKVSWEFLSCLTSFWKKTKVNND